MGEWGRMAARAAAALAIMAAPAFAWAQDAASAPAKDQTWAIHGQATLVDQGDLAFTSPYRGPNSLSPSSNGRETVDATLFLGFRPWRGAEIWVNQEVDQGFGLQGTLGAAGFPSGEAYKVGDAHPYLRLQRAFIRQTIDLGGKRAAIDPDQNQLGGSRTADRVVITAGKFSVVDVFDTNKFAHDPRADFFNWSVIDGGAFDYAADAWGYSVGAATELYKGRWTVRGGVFDLSVVPNSTTLDGRFGQFQLVGEVEERHSLGGQDGKIAVTGFLSRARMGTFADALARAAMTGGAPSTADVRRYASRAGISANLEQQLTKSLGLFARAGVANGDYEPYEFADIDASVAAGLSLSGDVWKRKDDTVGLALVSNEISKIHQAFLAAGGLGILIGDGRLPHYGPERIVEAYYSVGVAKGVKVSFDGQVFDNLAYNRDRGPATILAIRLHGQI
jgi:high affinity Mn2+ porin